MEHRILICAPTGQDALLTAKVFASVGINGVLCETEQDLVQQLASGAAGLLLVEEVMRDPLFAQLAAYIAAQPTWSDLPILLMTHSGADSLEVRRAVARLGNVTLLERPVRTIALIAATRSAIRARERQYQVRDADQRKDEFLATLAHELRNPLAPIRTAMGILQNLAPDHEAITRLRQVVDRQVTHLTRLVDDLLDVARITSGKVALKKSRITLASVVNHAVEISSSAMAAKNHAFTLVQPQTPHLLDADHARLVQSIGNLLVNAAKFTPADGLVQLSAEVEGHMAIFKVRDNGIGLEPGSQAHIFDLFAQTQAPGEASTGLGIGLSLARQFSEMHGGTLQACSDGLGKGSEFILKLPVVVPGDAQDQVISPSEGLAEGCAVPVAQNPSITMLEPFNTALGHTTTTATAVKTVLVVDDNVDAADTLGALLDMDGFAVKIVYDGTAAIEAVKASAPDAVVMDIGMPGLDGYDTARILRQTPGGDKLLLIALTGWGQQADRARAGNAGFNHHLVKPVDYDALMHCLQR